MTGERKSSVRMGARTPRGTEAPSDRLAFIIIYGIIYLLSDRCRRRWAGSQAGTARRNWRWSAPIFAPSHRCCETKRRSCGGKAGKGSVNEIVIYLTCYGRLGCLASMHGESAGV